MHIDGVFVLDHQTIQGKYCQCFLSDKRICPIDYWVLPIFLFRRRFSTKKFILRMAYDYNSCGDGRLEFDLYTGFQVERSLEIDQ